MGYSIEKIGIVENPVFFQFPLWDTLIPVGAYLLGKYNFQFPLWDTGITPSTLASVIMCLSIPFMGYQCNNKA